MLLLDLSADELAEAKQRGSVGSKAGSNQRMAAMVRARTADIGQVNVGPATAWDEEDTGVRKTTFGSQETIGAPDDGRAKQSIKQSRRRTSVDSRASGASACGIRSIQKKLMGRKQKEELKADAIKRKLSMNRRESGVVVDACGLLMKRLIQSEYFDYVMVTFVFLNAICLGWQADYMSEHRSSDTPIYFRLVDAMFCVVFATELGLRAYIFRRNFFRMEGWKWNVFDSVVVGFQVFDEITKMFLSSTDAHNIFDKMGMLRLVRLGRIMRVIRVVRLIPELKSNISGI